MTIGLRDASLATLRRRLHDAVAAWRELGAARGAVAAARLIRRTAAMQVRQRWLAHHPLRIRSGTLREALGGLTAIQALGGPALDAMPTVGALEDSLISMSAGERESIIRRADDIVFHTFDLLGSGATNLGRRIDWQRDFKSGRSWPVEHYSRLTVSYPDGSDIKVPWELSRFQHLPLLAAAFRLTGEQRYLDEVGAQLRDWIEVNPVEFGVNWACTMDVGIRAVNWVATLTLLAAEERAAAAPWIEEACASLLLHGRFIRSHLEWAPVRGNHYLSDIVGLLLIAALFSRGHEGAAWVKWASREIVAELEHQVREDGCDHEASIPYHRLVTELFICGLQAVEVLEPGAITRAVLERFDRMFDFITAYIRPDGLAPQMGDADDGRFLPLCDYRVQDYRRHDHLYAQAARSRAVAEGHAAFPDGGWFVMRSGDLYAIVRCGDVGVGGVGSHAHCDQLAFELCFGGQPLVIDPGAYLYTADIHARAAFRATAAHSTLEIDETDQNPIDVDRPFQLEDRTRAELIGWETDGARATFVGRHHGYERLLPRATHERRVEFDGEALTVTVTDTIHGDGCHRLSWSLPLAPAAVACDGELTTARFPSGARLSVEAPLLSFELANGWYSPSYGVRYRTPVLRARRMGCSGEDTVAFTLRISPASV
jgi:uncharacterized heparinase superfamily protein